MHPRYPLYIVPKPNHHFVLGATQIESEDDSPISVRSTLGLLSAAYSIHAGFGEARIINAQSGLRPAFVDHQPKIHVDETQRIVSVNGLFRHGYLIGPAVSVLNRLCSARLTRAITVFQHGLIDLKCMPQPMLKADSPASAIVKPSGARFVMLTIQLNGKPLSLCRVE